MKAAIIGYGKSGKAAENILKSEGYTSITVFDDGNNDFASISDFRDIFDCTVVSPGINLRKMPNAPENFTSEIELAHKHKPADAKVIAVTGTNGKSTVTSLISQILKNAGIESIACGNIGLTYGEAVSGWAFDCYVVELSSFQTGMLKEFDTDAVIVTNIAEDHMDRYDDIDDYTADKMNLLNFIKADGRLIVEEDEYLLGKVKDYKGKLAAISPELKWMPTLDGTKLDFALFSVDISGYELKGRHNIVNLAFALLAADALCNFEGDVTDVIKNLKGLEHRCEYVATVNGVDYINDSKGTNVHSTLSCLKGFDKGVNIILGGKDKNGDFLSLAPVINEKASRVITYGDAGEKIASVLKPEVDVPVVRVEKLDDAVSLCRDLAKEGEKVVLSPACASFDQFRSFEHRGTYFKELILEGIK
jgi:UDP-N-acetylmuramoylalanine--D-glutamate ligase